MSAIILSCVVVQTIIALYLFNTHKIKDDFEKILNATLIILVFHLGTKFFILTVLKDSFLYGNNITGFSFSYGPMLYLAAMSMVGNPLSRKAALVHLLPFLIFAAVYMVNTVGYLFFHVPNRFIEWYKSFYHWLATLSMILYPVITLRIVSKTSSPHSSFFKYRSRLVRSMCFILLLGVTIGATWSLLHILANGRGEFDPRLVPYFFLAVWPVLILRYKIFSSSLTSSSMVNPEKATFLSKEFPEPDHEHKGPDKQYRKSALDKSKMDRYEVQLKKYMEVSKPYLDTDISLEDLASKTNIPKHHLTQLLSERFGKNFYVFVNEYRIEEAITRLKDPATDESILSLAYECGFNSKSSFNNYFKKLTGLTPSLYRKQHVFKETAGNNIVN